MNGFERRKEQKKESIRRAAMELFKVYGFEKVSIADIAQKARVSHVTIYNHFGNKEELVNDIVKNVISELVAKSRTIIDGDLPFLEKLELIVFDKARVASQYQGELMQAVRNNAVMQQDIISLWRREIDRLLLDLVAQGKKMGYINEGLSDDAILYYFEIIRNGAFASSQLLDRIKPNARLAQELNNLFLYGLVDRK